VCKADTPIRKADLRQGLTSARRGNGRNGRNIAPETSSVRDSGTVEPQNGAGKGCRDGDENHVEKSRGFRASRFDRLGERPDAPGERLRGRGCAIARGSIRRDA